MKTLELKDLDKINEIASQMRNYLNLQNLLRKKETTAIEVRIKNQNTTLLTNSVNINYGIPDHEWKKEFHEITKDYLEMIQVHTTTMIVRKQEELLQVLHQ